MAAAIALGIVVGAGSFVPYTVGFYGAKRTVRKGLFKQMALLMLALLVSAVILMGSSLTCFFVAPDYIVPFALAEVLAFVMAILGFGIATLTSRQRVTKQQEGR